MQPTICASTHAPNAAKTVGFVDLKRNRQTLQQKCGKIFSTAEMDLPLD
jgi:hypothetical protein